MLLVLGIDRGLFLLKAKHVEGNVINSYTSGSMGPGRVSSTSYQIEFEYEGYSYTFWTSRFSGTSRFGKSPVIFNPDDPMEAYQNSFGDFWLWGFIIVGIIFVPWSAASLSFIGKNERLVIGRKKFGLEKIAFTEDY